MEVLIPETRQVADVLVTLAGPTDREPARRVAVEVQCSPLSSARWRERAALYAEAGVLDLWLIVEEDTTAKRHHTREKQDGLLGLSPLPGTILADRGRVFLARTNPIRLQEGQAAGVTVQVLHGLAAQYADLDDPGVRLAAVERRPVHQQPAWLAGRPPWQALAQPVQSFAPDPGQAWKATLEACTLSLETSDNTAPSDEVLWVTAEHRDADRRARDWERSNARWHATWRPRRDAYDRERAAERAAEQRAAEAVRRTRLAHLHRAVGATLRSRLPALLAAARRLAAEGRRRRAPRTLRTHAAIPEGMQRWPLASWTPLADLPVPLGWVFGVDRRLWQMVVYAYTLSAMYAKPFREEQDITVRGFERVETGFALKALGAKRLLGLRQAQHVQSQLDDLGDVLGRVLPPECVALVAHDRDGDPVLSLDVHRARHLVVAAYFEALAGYSFLRGPDFERAWGGEPHQRGSSDAALEDNDDQPTTALLTRATTCLNTMARIGGAEFDEARLGQAWLNLVEQVMGASTGEFAFVTPMLPPCLDRSAASQVRMAMRQGALRVSTRGLHGPQGMLYEVPERFRSSSKRRRSRFNLL